MPVMAYENNSIFWVEVDKIVPNPFQPRREFDEQNLRELAESVRMYGILQPLTVTRKEVPLEDGAFRSEYELVAGERRLRAAKMAGLQQVPVIIRSGEETELMKLELAIIENLQREDLNPIDRAMAFKQLATQFGLSHAEVAKKVGRSREYVSNSIRLLQLPDTIVSALSQGDISDGHARTLLMLNDKPEEQDVIFREILLKKLSVREVERISRKVAQDKVRKKKWHNTDPELIELEKQFSEGLGTRVQISKTDYGGKVVIDYFSPEDLQKLLSLAHAQIDENESAQTAGRESDAALGAIHEATPLEEVSSPPPSRGEFTTLQEHAESSAGEEVSRPSDAVSASASRESDAARGETDEPTEAKEATETTEERIKRESAAVLAERDLLVEHPEEIDLEAEAPMQETEARAPETVDTPAPEAAPASAAHAPADTEPPATARAAMGEANESQPLSAYEHTHQPEATHDVSQTDEPAHPDTATTESHEHAPSAAEVPASSEVPDTAPAPRDSDSESPDEEGHAEEATPEPSRTDTVDESKLYSVRNFTI